MPNRVPRLLYNTPSMNHTKEVPYIDYPIAYNEIVTQEAFYIEYDWTFVTSDAANTLLYKWNGNGWTQVTGWSNPEFFYGHGFFAVSTTAAAYVTITEHVDT